MNFLKKNIASTSLFSSIAILPKNTIISGIIIIGDLIQTLTITRFAYNLTNSKYGHEVCANI